MAILLTSWTTLVAGTQEDKVSFEKQIVPILQSHCTGCHQAANSQGGFVLTDYESLLNPGDSGDASVVPGKPDQSYLMELIQKDADGLAEMPIDADPLSDSEIELVRRWIAEGAINDSSSPGSVYTSENPPVYEHLPAITSVDFSADGQWMAVNGFNEVFLLNTEQFEVRRRLIGMSTRIETVRFSPDGTRIAVSGGVPGQYGEIQVWKVATGKLELSKTFPGDCAFGVNWSPDGKLLSFGLTDTTVRCIDAISGKQVLFQGAHDDWVRDTVFSVDGKRLVSVGRDTTCKLIEVETERFVDNLTSITPAILKGGISSVARHPARDEVVIGCADGILKVYRMDRQTKRVIGDDANLIRKMQPMVGRIESVDVTADGKRIAAATSLDGQGQLKVYSYEFETSLTEELKAILRKLPGSWNQAERKKIEDYWQRDIRILNEFDFPTGIYSIAFSHDGKYVTVGGADGLLRICDLSNGQIKREFSPVSINESGNSIASLSWEEKTSDDSSADTDNPLSNLTSVQSISVMPKSIELKNPIDYVQLLVTAHLADGTHVDVTDHVDLKTEHDSLVANRGLIRLSNNFNFDESKSDLQTGLQVQLANFEQHVPVNISIADDFNVDFIKDVNPVLTRLGCNAGACHGSQSGRNGFKLSLRGYDAIYDIRALTDELSSRRVNLVRPDSSLMLTKPSAAVPHEGGKLMSADSKYYQVVRNWIQNGAKLDVESPRVVALAIQPDNPTLAKPGDQQQIRVIATYDDTTVRDVTREAFIESGNLEVASIVGTKAAAIRRGEAAILARYEGAYAATTATVMGERSGFVWKQPDTFNKVDELILAKWKRLKIHPSELSTDEEFLRRVYLDLTGLPPKAKDVREFIADKRNPREKRNELVDRLIGNDDFVQHWTNKWADLLQVNRKFLGADGASKFRAWILDKVVSNVPYNQFVYEIITASGSNHDNPAASYYKILRTPEDTMENTTHLFLGTRFNCNKCHDHPFEKWTQDQYYETAAFFSQFKIEKDPRSGDKRIGGSAVESAKPIYEKISDMSEGDMKHERTGQVVDPQFPFDCDFENNKDASRREQFAAWLTSGDNPYFASSYVNRLWGYLMGVGLIEPLDDIRAGNPATNPELLDYLTDEFVSSGFDSRHVLQLICKSRAYQLSFRTNEFNQDDFTNYSHALPRRLSAEVLYDAIHFVTGSQSNIPGQKAGVRAAMLPDSGARLPSGFLATLGRPNRESACECERSNEMQLGSVLAMISGPDVSKAINDTKNSISQLVQDVDNDDSLVAELYLQVLNRHATAEEIKLAKAAFKQIEGDHQQLQSQLAERSAWFDKTKPALESERQKQVDETTRQLDDVIKSQMPDLLEKEEQRTKQIAAAEQALKSYRKDEVTFFAGWRNRQLNQLQWHPLALNNVTAESGRSFSIQDDRSVLADKNVKKSDVYTIETATDLTGITGLRLELLPDPKLDAQGPGTAHNGNFVLNELEFEIAPLNESNNWRKVEFRSARSYFDQPNYPIKNIIDGKVENAKGWATSGHIGKVNWACLETKLPVGFKSGSKVRIKLHQKFDNEHQIGRFRISLTTFDGPISLSVSEQLANEISQPLEKFKKKRKQELIKLAERDDPKWTKLKKDLANARKPLDIPRDIVRIREKLKRVSAPVPEDALLVQLKRDFEYSETQIKQSRLTAAQDLTWALINSPEFLFNR